MMKKISASCYRLELVMTSLAGLISNYALYRISESVSKIWAKGAIFALIGVVFVQIIYSLYNLLATKGFNRSLIARNDERYQLIREKSVLFSFKAVLFVLGFVTSFEGIRYVYGDSSWLTISAWEYNLLLLVLGGISFALAKIYYTRFL